MERLTEYDEYGNADIIGVDSDDLQFNLSYEEFNKVTEALNKLAAYEDIGPSPEQLKEIDRMYSELAGKLQHYEGLKQQVKRSRTDSCMRELKKRRKEQEKALEAYKAIQDYCNNREKCGGCLFEMEDGAPGVCIMECQDVPSGWQELELDELLETNC